MTKLQQTIVMVSIIGTILDEYKEADELTPAVRNLKFTCKKFMMVQSGTRIIPFIGSKIVDSDRHKRFVNTVMIGDRIWQKAINRYAGQSVTIEAVSLIKAIYDFAPDLLAKFAHISNKKITSYINESKDGDNTFKRQGAVIGGFLIETLALEMGIKINGRLSALKNKVQNDLGRVA